MCPPVASMGEEAKQPPGLRWSTSENFSIFKKCRRILFTAFSEHFKNFKQKDQLQTDKFIKLYTMLGENHDFTLNKRQPFIGFLSALLFCCVVLYRLLIYAKEHEAIFLGFLKSPIFHISDMITRLIFNI